MRNRWAPPKRTTVELAATAYWPHTGVMPAWGSFSYAFGPLFALSALLLVVWLLRRNFRGNRSQLADDDVLAPLLGPHTWGECSRLAKDLSAAGIRHRVVDMTTSYQVQVPADDLAAARVVMNAAPPGR